LLFGRNGRIFSIAHIVQMIQLSKLLVSNGSVIVRNPGSWYFLASQHVKLDFIEPRCSENILLATSQRPESAMLIDHQNTPD
jgi:hypothetical protein